MRLPSCFGLLLCIFSLPGANGANLGYPLPQLIIGSEG